MRTIIVTFLMIGALVAAGRLDLYRLEAAVDSSVPIDDIQPAQILSVPGPSTGATRGDSLAPAWRPWDKGAVGCGCST